jgi:hypothetical protein
MQPYEDWGIYFPGDGIDDELLLEVICDYLQNTLGYNSKHIQPYPNGIRCYNREITRKVGKTLKEKFGGNLKFEYNIDPH